MAKTQVLAIVLSYLYGLSIESQWTVGAPVSFFDGDSQTLTDSGVVLASDPPRHLMYTFRNEFKEQSPQEGYSRVSFTIEPHDGMVKLTLVHYDKWRNEVARRQQKWADTTVAQSIPLFR